MFEKVLSDEKALATVVGALVAFAGVVVTMLLQLLIQFLTQRWQRENEETKARRAEAAEHAKEQTRLGKELLQKVERFVSLVSAPRPEHVEGLRLEVIVQSEELRSAKARELMDAITTAMHIVGCPDGALEHFYVEKQPAYPIREAARAVLGAVIRNEELPDGLPMLTEHLAASRELDEAIEHARETHRAYYDSEEALKEANPTKEV